MEAVIVIWKFQYNNNPVMIRFMIQKHCELYHFPRVSSLEIEREKKKKLPNSPHLLPVKLHNPALSACGALRPTKRSKIHHNFFFLFDTVAL